MFIGFLVILGIFLLSVHKKELDGSLLYVPIDLKYTQNLLFIDKLQQFARIFGQNITQNNFAENQQEEDTNNQDLTVANLKAAYNKLDKVPKINSFEQIGWINPELEKAKAILTTTKFIRKITIQDFIYPVDTINLDKPPKCMFLPAKEVVRSLIELAASLCQENLDL